MQIDHMQNRYASIASVSQNMQAAETKCDARDVSNTRSFEELLRQAVSQREGPAFSKHAEFRMSQREISLSADDMARLTDAIGRAEHKGVKNTLVLLDQMAFIVNVPDNVVITAMNGQDLKENVFTQIDGAVIV